MSCRVSRLLRGALPERKRGLIPMSVADMRDAAILRQRREEKRRRQELARAHDEGHPA